MPGFRPHIHREQTTHGVYVYGLLLMIQNRALRDTSSSQLPVPPHIDTPARLTKKHVIVAGVSWVAWQWWENWEGICEVEFSLSLSLFISRNQFTLYFSCSDTLRLPRTLYLKAFFGTWNTILGALDGPWTALWRLMAPLSRTGATLSQSW